MRTMIPSVLILLLWGAALSLAQLPPEILADFYLLRAQQAIDESDPARARAEIDKITLLQKEHKLDLPDEFHFRYAKAAGAADMPDEAHDAVVKYLTAAGREGRHYEEALQLMNQVQSAIEASKESQEASNKPSPPPQETSQFTSAGQLGAGGTTEGQEQKQALLTATDSTEALPTPESETAPEGAREAVDWIPQPDVKPEPPSNRARSQAAIQAADCTLWRNNNSYKFFKTANLEDVMACLDAGANPMSREEFDITPLHAAAKFSDDPAIMEALLEAGADIGATTVKGDGENTPLHTAARFNENAEIIRVLVAAGASLEARDRWQWTPLHRAAYWNKNPEVIQALVDAGANPNARNKKGKKPMDIARKRNRRILAAAGGTWTQKSAGSGGLGALIAGAAVVGVGAASGASTESILAGVEAVASSQHAATGGGQQTAVQNPVGAAGNAGGGGSCEIPGYPRPPGGVANLGFSWCPASVDFQVRAFALQAAGAQCALATGSSSMPAQVQARQREITASCGRLAALSARGGTNCHCPPGLGGPGYSEDASSIDREQERREQQAKRQEEARQAAQRERQARQEAEARQAAERRRNEINRSNAEILNSNCSCISIKDDGRYACMDGFVVGKDSSGKPLCDIKR